MSLAVIRVDAKVVIQVGFGLDELSGHSLRHGQVVAEMNDLRCGCDGPLVIRHRFPDLTQMREERTESVA